MAGQWLVETRAPFTQAVVNAQPFLYTSAFSVVFRLNWKLLCAATLLLFQPVKQTHQRGTQRNIKCRHAEELVRCALCFFSAPGLSTGAGPGSSSWCPGETCEPGQKTPLSAEHRWVVNSSCALILPNTAHSIQIFKLFTNIRSLINGTMSLSIWNIFVFCFKDKIPKVHTDTERFEKLLFGDLNVLFI